MTSYLPPPTTERTRLANPNPNPNSNPNPNPNSSPNPNPNPNEVRTWWDSLDAQPTPLPYEVWVYILYDEGDVYFDRFVSKCVSK